MKLNLLAENTEVDYQKRKCHLDVSYYNFLIPDMCSISIYNMGWAVLAGIPMFS